MAKKPQKELPELRTSRNFDLLLSDIESPSSDTQTVPDQTPDLRTLLGKRQNGHIVPVLDGRYTDQPIPDLELMDEVEILQYRMDMADTMADLDAEHHRVTKELEKRHNDEKLAAHVASELEKLKKPSGQEGEQ